MYEKGMSFSHLSLYFPYSIETTPNGSGSPESHDWYPSSSVIFFAVTIFVVTELIMTVLQS